MTVEVSASRTLTRGAALVPAALGVASLGEAITASSPEVAATAGLAAMTCFMFAVVVFVPARPIPARSAPEAWKRLRSSYWAAQSTWVAAAISAAGIVTFAPSRVRFALALLPAVIPFLAWTWLAMRACPACGQHYFLGLKPSPPWRVPSCQRCGTGP